MIRKMFITLTTKEKRVKAKGTVTLRAMKSEQSFQIKKQKEILVPDESWEVGRQKQYKRFSILYCWHQLILNIAEYDSSFQATQFCV